MTAITLGKIDFDPLPENELNPDTDFNWAALETLKDSDGAEKLGHVFVTHRRRTLPGAAEEAEQLVEALNKASALNISMDDQFDLQDVPMNAKFDDKPISICLTVLRGFGDAVERRGAKQLYEWVTRRGDEQFKPIAATQDVDKGMVFKTLEGHEDISHIDYDPEKVSTTGGLVRLEE